jgi:REP element-mobilizing transposase RayT
MYHLVFPTKYRRLVIDDVTDKLIRDICLEIGNRYEIHFVEIGTDKDHVHFLVQSVPMLTVTRIVMIIKSITARQVFDKMPDLKKKLWGSSLWTSGYYASTVGKHGNETVIGKYVKEQGRASEYVQIHKDQLRLL